jgi:BioD-like phosphotransacetylase family protein
LAKTEGIYRDVLAGQGIETLGIIPRSPELAAPTVAEFYETLGGDILTGEDKFGNIVEDVLVGAMTIESALGYFRRSANKAVVTGGDRSEIALAALETDTAVLILTGGFYPNVKVIARAAEKGVPVILVHYDTYTTIEKLAEVSRIIHAGDTRAIALARESVTAYCDIDKLSAWVRGTTG